MKHVGAIVVLTGSIALLTAGPGEAVPYITHVADTPSGYTMVVSGGGYDPGTVQATVYVPGPPLREDREKMPALVREMAARYDGKAKTLPVKPPAEKIYTAPNVKVTGRTVMATLLGGARFAPAIMPNYTGIVWLKDGSGLSNPAAVNRIQAHSLMRSVSRPGELNRLYGFKLIGDPYIPNYIFLRRADGGKLIEPERVPVTSQDGMSENYCIQFRVPADLPDGEYQVFAHNNSGGEYGFSQALPLTVTSKPLFREAVYNAGENGVVGDGFTDNLKSLQALVDKAGAEGGGTVFLPPGSYRLSDTLQLREGVILAGAGRDATTIFYRDLPSAKKKYIWFISARDANRTSIEDLTVRCGYPMTLTICYYNAGTPVNDVSIRRCRIQGADIRLTYGVNAEVSDNILEGACLNLSNMRWSVIRGNDICVGRLGGNPMNIWSSEYCTLERNRMHESSRGIVWQLHGAFGSYRNFIHANVVESTRMGGNAGETYLFEGAGFKWYGKPGVFSANGFTVPGAGWKPDAMKKSFAVVVDGPGTGQYVRIAGNSDDTVTLEGPWPALQPPAGGSVTIMCGTVENVFVNNRDVNCDNSVMFYAAGAINNRIHRHRSENALGISVWSDADASRNLLVPDYFNIFEGNVLEDQGSFWMTKMGDMDQKNGVRNLNNVYRANFISDPRRKRENQYSNVWEYMQNGGTRLVQPAFWMDLGRTYGAAKPQSPIWIDTLIERNYITRCDWGVEMRSISGGTVVRENTFFDVKRPVIDEGSGSLVEKNRVEKPELEAPPSPAAVGKP